MSILAFLVIPLLAVVQALPPIPLPSVIDIGSSDPEQELEDWSEAIQVAIRNTPEYPTRRFTGRGIVLAAGGRKYFTCLYITLRVLRDIHHTKLPIEVVYAGPNELPSSAIKHISDEYDVSFIDITKATASLGVSVQGFQIKPLAILLSSFKEVLFLDADNIPLFDPESLFDMRIFKKSGAVLWPDFCQVHSVEREVWAVFGMTTPSWPRDRQHPGPYPCGFDHLPEVESGQMLIHKKKSWAAVYLAAFVAVNHRFFLRRLFQGDKQVFPIVFNATASPFHMTSHQPHSIGRVSTDPNGGSVFCGNTMGQRHPVTGKLLFLHRNLAKFVDAHEYLQHDPVPRAWSYIMSQLLGTPWAVVRRGNIREDAFVMPAGHNIVQMECVGPSAPGASVSPVGKEVVELETACLGFLRDLAQLPYYPGNLYDCAGDKAFFCAHG